MRTGSPFAITGTVEDRLRGQGLSVTDADGTVHLVHCFGPSWFWRDLDVLRPAIGDAIEVEGFALDCGTGLENVAARVVIDGLVVELRDPATGLPRWSSGR